MTIQIEQLRKPNAAQTERLRLDTFTYMLASKTPCADKNAGIAQNGSHGPRKPAAHGSFIEEWKTRPRTQKRANRTPGAARTPLAENDPFAQAETPDALHRHGDEFADHLGTAERRSRPAYKPGAEQEVPNIQGDEHDNAAPEVARRLERDVAVHKEIERARTRDGNAVRDARRQRDLGQSEHAELDERLHDRYAVIHERLPNATSKRRLTGRPFGGSSLVLGSCLLGLFGPFLGGGTSSLDSAELPFGNMCSCVFHRRDSKTHVRPAPKRYPFVAVRGKVPPHRAESHDEKPNVFPRQKSTQTHGKKRDRAHNERPS